MINKFPIGYKFRSGISKYVIKDILVTRNTKDEVVGVEYLCDFTIGRGWHKVWFGTIRKSEAALVAVNEEMKTKGSR